MAKNHKQKAVGNYLIVILPPIVLGLLIGLFVEQKVAWLKPTATAGALLAATTAVLSISENEKKIRKLVWWLHTLFGLAVAGYSIFQPLLSNKGWSRMLGIIPGFAIGLTFIILNLIALGAKDLGKKETAVHRTAQQRQTTSGRAVTERAQVNLFTPRGRETQSVDVTQTLEDIGHGARANLLAAANESRRLDLEEIQLLQSLGDPQEWSSATRTMVARRFGEELANNLTCEENGGVEKSKSKRAQPIPKPIISGWGYGR